MSAARPAIRKAVVPMAGLGTRHFPASHACKKELFPIVGADGIARALFHYHVIELDAAGIEEICLIVQPGEDKAVRSYLDGPDDAYLSRLDGHPPLRREANEMRRLSGRVRFVEQRTQEGYGHAVFLTRAFAGGEPVLLCLGDHLFRGRGRSPYRALADVSAAANGRSVSAVNRIGPDELKGYGTIAGARRPDDRRLIDVSLIVEKPDVTTARAKLHVDGLPADTWLGWLGMHVLGPGIYDVLDQMIRDDIRDRGEFQLTRAQEMQRQREGYLAVELDDVEQFDFGTPEDFVRSVASFSSQATRQ
jgi:UTP--glucose-1-phosphate uridylyltransferase